MNQNCLPQARVSTPALARNSDPETSKAAAAKFRSGSINSLILDALRENEIQCLAQKPKEDPRYAGMNGQELALAIAKPLNSVTPRFKGLLAAGLIKKRTYDLGTLFIRDGQIVWVIA